MAFCHRLFYRKASQSLRPQAQRKFKTFLPAACTSAKILLGSQTCERSECAAASRIFSKRSLAKQGSFLMYQHHSRLWGLFFTGGV